MVEIKGDENSEEDAMANQVNTENSAAGEEDKIESKATYDPEKSKTSDSLNSEKKSNPLKIIFIVSIAVLVIIIVVVLLIFFISYFSGKEKLIKIDNQLGEVRFENGKICLINLSESINLSKVETINFGFYDKKGNKYNYTAPTISKVYKINASLVGLENFDKIIRIDSKIKYKAADPNKPGPSTNQTNNTDTTCKDNCTSLGKQCGNWTICNNSVNCGNCTTSCNETGQCVVSSCTNSTGCSKEGLFCNGSMRYNCTYVGGCLNKTALAACSTGEQCINGTCIGSYSQGCTHNNNCTSLTDVCSRGLCNSSGDCEINYNSSDICRPALGECDAAESCNGTSKVCPVDLNKTDEESCSLGKCKSGKCIACLTDSECPADGCSVSEYRDYFCNSTNLCQHNVITKEENTTNNNCDDSINNDCDGLIDWQDEGCIASRICGNGLLEGAECDDGNTNIGDGCSATCTVEFGWHCTGEPSVCEIGSVPSMSPFVRFWSWIKDVF